MRSDLSHARIAGEPANVLEWHLLTGADFARLDKRRCVAMVTCSPLEVHGPHLPVVTDNCEAEGLAVRTRAKLAARHPEITFLHLPPVFVATDVLPHVGSVMFRSSTVVRVLTDLGRSLARQGFRDIWVGNFHGGPRHFVAIEKACHEVNRRYGARMVSMFSLLAKRLTEGTSNLSNVLSGIDGLSAELLDGDTHAGAVETSMMLHLLGEHVDPSFQGLERSTVDVKLAREGRAPRQSRPGRSSVPELFRGFLAVMKYFEEETYCGAPGAASARIGGEVLELLSSRAADALGELWRGEIGPEECHSPVWPYRFLFLNETLNRLVERAARYETRVF